MSAGRARRIAAWTVGGAAVGGALGLVCGIAYSFGGLIVDLLTIGLNGGTALAFLALVAMPAMFAIVGLASGCVLGLGAELSRRLRGAER